MINLSSFFFCLLELIIVSRKEAANIKGDASFFRCRMMYKKIFIGLTGTELSLPTVINAHVTLNQH